MDGPYRTLAEPDGEEPPASGPVSLGARRSSHARGGALGAAAVAMGGWFQIDVHENGLALQGAVLGRVELPWDEIDAIHYDFDGLMDGPPRIELVMFDRTRAAVPSDLQGIEWVIEALERGVTNQLTPRARAALARGERLVFGPLELELDGIVLKGKNLSWSDLARVDAERDSLVFHAQEPVGRFGWVRIVDVPHPQALLNLLRLRTTVVMSGLRL